MEIAVLTVGIFVGNLLISFWYVLKRLSKLGKSMKILSIESSVDYIRYSYGVKWQRMRNWEREHALPDSNRIASFIDIVFIIMEHKMTPLFERASRTHAFIAIASPKSVYHFEEEIKSTYTILNNSTSHNDESNNGKRIMDRSLRVCVCVRA